MTDKLRARPADQALAVPATPANAVDGPSGFDPSRIARKALQEIRDLEPQPFDKFPADWSAQIDACEKCQAYATHPIQQGICDEHRRPLWDRERHDRHEAAALGYRMKGIAMDALYAIAMEARSGETEGLDPKDDSAGLQGIAQ